MSQLLLIRHGQATPFEADTDRLSPLGENQARAVGAYLLASGMLPSRVVHGPLLRQTRTAELAARAAGDGWPAPQTLPGLAEYDGDGLFRLLAPKLAEQNPEFAALSREAQERREFPDRNRSFQKLMEALLDSYLLGQISDPQVESWANFRARVRAATANILASVNGSTVTGSTVTGSTVTGNTVTGNTVLAFTSGGVIGSVVADVLGAPDAAALKLNWRVRNASVTRLTFGSGRVSLDTFNETSHLTPDLLSWR